MASSNARIQQATGRSFKESPNNHIDRSEPLRESFEGIYLDLSKQPGRCRFAESGLGWKPSAGGDTFTLDSSNVTQAQWSRAARGYELRVFTKNTGVIQLDGFQQEVNPTDCHGGPRD